MFSRNSTHYTNDRSPGYHFYLCIGEGNRDSLLISPLACLWSANLGWLQEDDHRGDSPIVMTQKFRVE